MSDSNYPISVVDIRNIGGIPVSTNQGVSDDGTQRVVLASDQPAIVVQSTPNFATRSDTFAAAGNGITVDRSASPLSKYGIQVKGTGAVPTSWDVRLDGSLDGVNFTEILSHVGAVGDGQMVWTGALDSPCLYFRARCASITLGTATNIVVKILGMS